MNLIRTVLLAALMLAGDGEAFALDSYRYLHVTIDTPWLIFVFLFFLVFAPMILSVVLYWRSALEKRREEETGDGAAKDGAGDA
ncbi:MAG: hypothetical protein R8K47_06465 [Mariprofundaceae bacterium]